VLYKVIKVFFDMLKVYDIAEHKGKENIHAKNGKSFVIHCYGTGAYVSSCIFTYIPAEDKQNDY